MQKQEAMKKKKLERKMCVCLCVRVCFNCLHANWPFKHYFSSLFLRYFLFTCLPDLFFVGFTVDYIGEDLTYCFFELLKIPQVELHTAGVS